MALRREEIELKKKKEEERISLLSQQLLKMQQEMLQIILQQHQDHQKQQQKSRDNRKGFSSNNFKPCSPFLHISNNSLKQCFLCLKDLPLRRIPKQTGLQIYAWSRAGWIFGIHSV